MLAFAWNSSIIPPISFPHEDVYFHNIRSGLDFKQMMRKWGWLLMRVIGTLRTLAPWICSPFFRCWMERRLWLGCSDIASMSWVTPSLSGLETRVSQSLSIPRHLWGSVVPEEKVEYISMNTSVGAEASSWWKPWKWLWKTEPVQY